MWHADTNQIKSVVAILISKQTSEQKGNSSGIKKDTIHC